MYFKEIESGKIVEVFNIRDDHMGMPQFLVYREEGSFTEAGWQYVSAWRFKPLSPADTLSAAFEK